MGEPFWGDPPLDLDAGEAASLHGPETALEGASAHDLHLRASRAGGGREFEESLVRLEDADKQVVVLGLREDSPRVRVGGEVRDVDHGASEGRRDRARHEPARSECEIESGEPAPSPPVSPEVCRVPWRRGDTKRGTGPRSAPSR